MPIIAVTGGLSSGKSSVAGFLKEKCAVIFDSDRVVHEYYQNRNSSVYKKVCRAFPECIVGSGISREKLGDLVFKDKSRLAKLEKIVHPAVIKDLNDWIKKNKGSNKLFVAEVPLLFEKKLNCLFKQVVLVVSPKQEVIKRVTKKYHISPALAVKRLSLFMPLEKKIKKADYLIENNASLKELKKKVNILWKQIRVNA
jgi:dephospho-CoA kinase